MTSDTHKNSPDTEAVETEKSSSSSSTSSKNLFSYFPTASVKATPLKVPSSAPTRKCSTRPTELKKRKLQQEKHYCVVCHKTISRGNPASLMRHANDNHKNDRSYSYRKSIFPEWHKGAVIAKREKEARKAKRTENNELQERKDLAPVATESNVASASNEESNDIFDGIYNAAQEDRLDEDMGSIETRDLNNIQETVPKVQSVIDFQPAACNSSSKEFKCNDDISEIKNLLHVMMEKLEISKEKETHPVSESAQSINILKDSYCLVDIDGSCFQFFPGEFDGGIVRCKTCFAMICEKNPSLVGKDPTHAAMRQIESVPGNNFAAGLSLSKERTELLISGGNQSWYSFKSMMIEHASCSTNRNGGMAHYRALLAEKQRKKVKKSVLQVISNQLKCALFIVKSKTAALHYENVIGLLHSSGAAVGNIGHGRNQMIDLMKAFQAYLNRKTRDALLKAC